MTSLRYPFGLILSAVLAASAPGCGSAAPGPGGPEPAAVEEVGQLLRMFQEQNKPAPKSIQEAEKAGSAFPKAIAALKSGDVAIYWGVNLDEYGGASVLGYEKQAPEQGGVVILGDGSTVEMTAEQFRDAPKPPAQKLKQGGAGKGKAAR